MSILDLIYDEACQQRIEENRPLEQYVVTPAQWLLLLEELDSRRDQYAMGVDTKRKLKFVLVYLSNGQKCKVIRGR